MSVTKSLPWCLALVLGVAPLLASGATGGSSKFATSEATNIPGASLPAGTYSIHVVDHLSERSVVRVDGPGGTHYTFLALVNPDLPKPAAPGRITWKNAADGKEYLRGWLFAGERAPLEFVYPKADAVAIAKSNDAKVPAIDPDSEGRPSTIKGLSKSDLELVTLWLLSPTQVGPGDSSGGIKAERYTQVAMAVQKPVIARLPQTGSNLPWIALMGIFSFFAAISVRLLRRSYLHVD